MRSLLLINLASLLLFVFVGPNFHPAIFEDNGLNVVPKGLSVHFVIELPQESPHGLVDPCRLSTLSTPPTESAVIPVVWAGIWIWHFVTLQPNAGVVPLARKCTLIP